MLENFKVKYHSELDKTSVMQNFKWAFKLYKLVKEEFLKNPEVAQDAFKGNLVAKNYSDKEREDRYFNSIYRGYCIIKNYKDDYEKSGFNKDYEFKLFAVKCKMGHIKDTEHKATKNGLVKQHYHVEKTITMVCRPIDEYKAIESVLKTPRLKTHTEKDIISIEQIDMKQYFDLMVEKMRDTYFQVTLKNKDKIAEDQLEEEVGVETEVSRKFEKRNRHDDVIYNKMQNARKNKRLEEQELEELEREEKFYKKADKHNQKKKKHNPELLAKMFKDMENKNK